ncbi:hypothetical protein [Tatumella morbirosei]|nr:hypothetical protein [Tatumella morbirosei]
MIEHRFFDHRKNRMSRDNVKKHSENFGLYYPKVRHCGKEKAKNIGIVQGNSMIKEKHAANVGRMTGNLPVFTEQ